MPNEVPFDIFGKTLNFTSQLLFVTFTKYTLSFTISCFNIFFRMKLTDSNQFHSIRKRIEYSETRKATAMPSTR